MPPGINRRQHPLAVAFVQRSGRVHSLVPVRAQWCRLAVAHHRHQSVTMKFAMGKGRSLGIRGVLVNIVLCKRRSGCGIDSSCWGRGRKEELSLNEIVGVNSAQADR